MSLFLLLNKLNCVFNIIDFVLEGFFGLLDVIFSWVCFLDLSFLGVMNLRNPTVCVARDLQSPKFTNIDNTILITLVWLNRPVITIILWRDHHDRSLTSFRIGHRRHSTYFMFAHTILLLLHIKPIFRRAQNIRTKTTRWSRDGQYSR